MTKDLKIMFEENKTLENDISEKNREPKSKFNYSVKQGLVTFEKNILNQQRKLRTGILSYISNSRLLVILVTPVIYFILIPALGLDLFVSIYQFICFPVYKISKVKRGDYIVFDRYQLVYLNWIERINCVYCSYFTGLIAYIGEISSRTEQYWCPIRHALKTKAFDKRHIKFVVYGDAESYKNKLEKLREELADT